MRLAAARVADQARWIGRVTLIANHFVTSSGLVVRDSTVARPRGYAAAHGRAVGATAAAAATAEENGEGEAAMELDDDVDDEALDKLEQDEEKEVAAEATATKKLREKHKKLAKEMAELRKQASAANGRLSVRKPGPKAKVEVVKQATSVAIGARPETLVGVARPSNHTQNG